MCAACHTVGGTDAEVSRLIRAGEGDDAPEFEVSLAPDLTHFASRTTFGGATFENTTDHLRDWIDNPSDLKPMRPELNDIDNGRILGMPDFGLGEQQIAELVALLQSFE